VRSCIVTSSKDANQQVFLAAYVVPHRRNGVGRETLVTYLRERLPLAMVPAAYVFMESLPRLPNGKVDRRALPPPALEAILDEQAFVAPRTPTEETLAAIWMSVLGADRVGIHDDFFALGGHSLRAMQVISRIRDALSVELPIRDLFENTTVASLSVRVTEAQAESFGGSDLDEMIREIQNLSDEEMKAIIEAESGSDA
jgi:surfactin family lipopeptide synthetase C